MALPTASDNVFPKVILEEAAAPATPSAGEVKVYAKTDGLVYSKDDAGTETLLSGGDAGTHIADTSDAHDASAISVLDTAANFTGTDVEAVLAELQDNIDGVAAAGGTGYAAMVTHRAFTPQGTDTSGGASRADAMLVTVPAAGMLLRNFVVRVTIAGSGTHQWGLFDYSSNAASCTKLAGGTGALNSTGWLTIAATGAPVTIAPGNYMLIFHRPSSNQATVAGVNSAAAGLFNKAITTYTWDDTPDLTATWAATSFNPSCYLQGDLNGSSQW